MTSGGTAPPQQVVTLEALRSAAKGQRVLLVLDDLWEGQEKLLNPLDATDPRSRLFVTTQIRKLLGTRGCVEIEASPLSEGEAAHLLLETAGLIEEDETTDLQLERASGLLAS